MSIMSKKASLENIQTTDGFKYFLLKTKGFKKQFTNEDTARRAFAKLEKQKENSGESFKIELFGKTGLSDQWTELDFVQISEND